jgi:hypothetical protein
MIADRDVWQAALLMVRRYGDDAETQAAMRADQMLEHGDLDGMLVWHAIISAIRTLQAMAPTGGEALH